MSDELPAFLKFVRRKIKGDGPNKRTGIPGDIGGGGLFSGADPDNPAVMHFGENGGAVPLGGTRVDPSEQGVDPSERQSSGLAEVVKLYAQQQEAALNTGGSGANPSDPATNPNPVAPTTRPRRASAEMPADASAPGIEYDPAAAATRPQRATPMQTPPSVQPAQTGAQPPPGVEYDETQSATRPRWSDPVNEEGEHNAALRDAADAPQDGWKRVVMPLFHGFLNGGVPGAVLGAVEGAVDSRAANRIKYGRRVAQSDARLGGLRARRKEGLEAEETRAGVRLKNSQAGYYEQRPDIEAGKAKAQELKANQQLIQKEIALRLKEPRPFDPENRDDADLFNRASAVGVHVQTGAFGDYKNPFTLEVDDPTDPSGTRRTRVVIPRGGGTPAPIMGEDGKPIVTKRVEQRDERGVPVSKVEQMENTQEYRAQLLGLSSARLQESMLNGLTGRAAKTFSTKTAGLFAERGRLETQINGYRTRASKREMSPAESERRIAELQKKVDEITGQIDDARSEAVGEMGGASRSRRAGTPAPSSPSQSGSKGRVSRKNFDKVREDNPSLRGKSDAQVEAELKARGIEVY
jgi:hypothetical protein